MGNVFIGGLLVFRRPVFQTVLYWYFVVFLRACPGTIQLIYLPKPMETYDPWRETKAGCYPEAESQGTEVAQSLEFRRLCTNGPDRRQSRALLVAPTRGVLRQLVECWPGVRCRPPDAQDSSRYNAFLELRVISHPTNIACKVDIDRQVAMFQIDLGIPYLRSLKPRRQEIYQEVWFRWCSLGAFNQFNCVYTSRINSFISPASHGVREGKKWLD